MKKTLLFLVILISCGMLAAGQSRTADSLAAVYKKTKQDTTLIQLLIEKGDRVFLDTNPDSGMVCLQKSLVMSRKIHYKLGEVKTLVSIANYSTRSGDLPGALRLTFDALPKALQINDRETIIFCYNTLGLVYASLNDYKKSLYYLKKLTVFAENIHSIRYMLIGYNNISRDYAELHKLDSALYYTQKAYDYCIKNHSTDQQVFPYLFRNLGIIKVERGRYAEAIAYFKQSIHNIPAIGNHYLLSEDCRRIAETYKKTNTTDSAIYYAKKALAEAKLDKSTELIVKTTLLLTNLYQAKNDYKEAFTYQQIMLNAKDSLFNLQKALQIQNLTFSDQQRRQEIESQRIAFQNRQRLYIFISISGSLILIAAILFFNNQRKKKANVILQRQNTQIETQRKALEQTLFELKTTQVQLIQAEKMASLGELTAGIAHEIQNPLNFVNNFSEVNTELLTELKEEIAAKNYEEVAALADDITGNEQKINMHGKRADAIVKGMLQHSQSGSGKKEPTDINALADECLRLSYHGLRAKDKAFNAEMATHFDDGLAKVNIITQDIGRVLLNLFNNAFYAVNQKAKTAGSAYKPTVEVSTFKLPSGGCGLSVKDNGTGIPDAIKDKIMQPFFTTKPAGEGTGLGLSLTYDMVVKGHGGSISVDTKEGEYTQFTIELPVK